MEFFKDSYSCLPARRRYKPKQHIHSMHTYVDNFIIFENVFGIKVFLFSLKLSDKGSLSVFWFDDFAEMEQFGADLS